MVYTDLENHNVCSTLIVNSPIHKISYRNSNEISQKYLIYNTDFDFYDFLWNFHKLNIVCQIKYIYAT